MPPIVYVILKRAAIIIVIAAVALYAGDSVSLWIRARHSTASDPFETLTAPRILAIGEKGGRTEFQLDSANPEQTVTCVHALFPHDGFAPCWQAKRTLHRPIPM